jgi:hypothetical protein
VKGGPRAVILGPPTSPPRHGRGRGLPRVRQPGNQTAEDAGPVATRFVRRDGVWRSSRLISATAPVRATPEAKPDGRVGAPAPRASCSRPSSDGLSRSRPTWPAPGPHRGAPRPRGRGAVGPCLQTSGGLAFDWNSSTDRTRILAWPRVAVTHDQTTLGVRFPPGPPPRCMVHPSASPHFRCAAARHANL